MFGGFLTIRLLGHFLRQSSTSSCHLSLPCLRASAVRFLWKQSKRFSLSQSSSAPRRQGTLTGGLIEAKLYRNDDSELTLEAGGERAAGWCEDGWVKVVLVGCLHREEGRWQVLWLFQREPFCTLKLLIGDDCIKGMVPECGGNSKSCREKNPGSDQMRSKNTFVD